MSGEQFDTVLDRGAAVMLHHATWVVAMQLVGQHIPNLGLRLEDITGQHLDALGLLKFSA